MTAKLELRGVRLGGHADDRDRAEHEPPALDGIDLSDYLVKPDSKFIWATLIEGAVTRVAPILAGDFRWHLLESNKRVLATSDHPVVFWNHEPNPLRGVGVATADEIYMPLDSRRLLALTRDTSIPQGAHDLSRMHARQVNRMLLAWSYRWVFHDPRDKLFNSDEFTEHPRRRPLMMINNREIYGPGDSWTYISEWLDR